MNKITHLMFGSYYPCIADKNMLLTCTKYLHAEQYKNIKTEEQKYLVEKWKYLREYFEAEELVGFIQQANDGFYSRWYSQQRKIYYDKNNEKIKQQAKESYERNKDKILEREKIYRGSHKEQIYKTIKKYAKANKDKINEKCKIKVTCECCTEIRRDYVTKHKLSIKHIQFMENQNKVS